MKELKDYKYGTTIKKSYSSYTAAEALIGGDDYILKEKEMITEQTVRRKVVVRHLPKALKALDEARVQSEKVELIEVLGTLHGMLARIEDLKSNIKETKTDIAKLEKLTGLRLTKEQKVQLTKSFSLQNGGDLDKLLPSLFE